MPYIVDLPRFVYEFPPVQYIHLAWEILRKGPAGALTGPSLIPLVRREQVDAAAEVLGGGALTPPPGTVAVLAVGLRVAGLAYRAHKLTFVVLPNPGRAEAVAIPLGYFYKRQLRLVAHDGAGRLLAENALDLDAILTPGPSAAAGPSPRTSGGRSAPD